MNHVTIALLLTAMLTVTACETAPSNQTASPSNQANQGVGGTWVSITQGREPGFVGSFYTFEPESPGADTGTVWGKGLWTDGMVLEQSASYIVNGDKIVVQTGEHEREEVTYTISGNRMTTLNEPYDVSMAFHRQPYVKRPVP